MERGTTWCPAEASFRADIRPLCRPRPAWPKWRIPESDGWNSSSFIQIHIIHPFQDRKWIIVNLRLPVMTISPPEKSWVRFHGISGAFFGHILEQRVIDSHDSHVWCLAAQAATMLTVAAWFGSMAGHGWAFGTGWQSERSERSERWKMDPIGWRNTSILYWNFWHVRNQPHGKRHATCLLRCQQQSCNRRSGSSTWPLQLARSLKNGNKSWTFFMWCHSWSLSQMSSVVTQRWAP